VDDPGRVVGMNRRDEPARGVDPDPGGHDHAPARDEDVEVRVNVKRRSFAAQRRKPNCSQAGAEPFTVRRPHDQTGGRLGGRVVKNRANGAGHDTGEHEPEEEHRERPLHPRVVERVSHAWILDLVIVRRNRPSA
jgi:hypothetical protein